MSLLEKYDLLREYGDLLRAVKAGRIADFHAAVDAHYSFFVEEGVYFAVERMKNVCYRYPRRTLPVLPLHLAHV